MPVAHGADEAADRAHARILRTQRGDLGAKVEVGGLDRDAGRGLCGSHHTIVTDRARGYTQPMSLICMHLPTLARSRAWACAGAAKKSDKPLLV
jgi:hypothetical protein